jgi:hypothetical protein
MKQSRWSKLVEKDKASRRRAPKLKLRMQGLSLRPKRAKTLEGRINPPKEQAVELPSQLAHNSLKTLKGSGAAIDGTKDTGIKPAKM